MAVGMILVNAIPMMSAAFWTKAVQNIIMWGKSVKTKSSLHAPTKPRASQILVGVQNARMAQVNVMVTNYQLVRMANIKKPNARLVHIAKSKTAKPYVYNMTARTINSDARAILFKNAIIINGQIFLPARMANNAKRIMALPRAAVYRAQRIARIQQPKTAKMANGKPQHADKTRAR